MNAMTLFTAEVFGVLLRVLECQGKRWLCAEDASKVLEYRTADGLITFFNRHREKLFEHSIKIMVDDSHAMRLFDEFALRYVCEHSKKTGAAFLLRWLDSGGLQAECDDKIPFDQNHTLTPAANDAVEKKAMPDNVVSLSPASNLRTPEAKAEKFVALAGGSQASTEEVLFFDANASSLDIWDNASFRLDAAYELLDACAGVFNSADTPNAVSAIAHASSLLLADSSNMFNVLYSRLYEHERRQ